ncbi:MAG: hypothetical protein RIS09_673 [Actinomycetota bacterium]
MNHENQITFVQSLVPKFAREFNLELHDVELLNIGFNVAFKITTPEKSAYTLRININSIKQPEELEAEAEWLERIRDLTDVNVPVPIRDTHGHSFSSLYVDAFERDVLSIAYPWIEGTIPSDDLTREDIFMLGRNMALLHNSSADWIPSRGRLSLINRPLMNSHNHYVTDYAAGVDEPLLQMIHELMSECEEVHERLSLASNLRPIHADLHLENVIRQPDGSQAIIDFDDCGIGFPLQDFAISIFYLRDKPDLERHLFEGYESVKAVPVFHQQDLELLLISRQLLLLNDLLTITTAEEKEFIPKYLEYTRLRFEHYKETGKFKLLRTE